MQSERLPSFVHICSWWFRAASQGPIVMWQSQRFVAACSHTLTVLYKAFCYLLARGHCYVSLLKYCACQNHFVNQIYGVWILMSNHYITKTRHDVSACWRQQVQLLNLPCRIGLQVAVSVGLFCRSPMIPFKRVLKIRYAQWGVKREY